MANGGASAERDVAIAGGGPAGAAASILLARAGLRVALVDAGGGAERLEGASPRLVAALAAQGLAREGIGPALRRRASWGTLAAAPNREHPVLRPAFDAGLRAQAADEGVEVLGAVIARTGPGDIDLADGRQVRAGLVVEARGRRAPVSGRRLRGPATVTVGGWTAGGDEGSFIATGAGGWSWSISAGGRGWTQASLPAGADLAAGFAAVTGHPLPPGPLVRASELRLSAPELDPALPRLGDAAVAIDPLSGHGLFWAIASALHAVPLVRALLEGEADLARRFHAARVVGTFWRQARVAREFYRAAGLTGPFWTARAAWPDDAPAEAPPPAAPFLRGQVVVRDGRLALARALVTPRDPDGVAFVAGREIAPILARLRGGALPDAADFARAVVPDLPPAEAGLIHHWLTERGITTADLPTEMEAT